MSIHVHQLLVWYMTNKHAAGYAGLFKGPEMEALERRGSFSCPGVTLCQPCRRCSLAWVRSALSDMTAHTCACTSKCTHLQRHTECMWTHADAHVRYFGATMWITHDTSASVSSIAMLFLSIFTCNREHLR